MVGVPKSRGCATCRARKIRCDETWPVCQQCRRSDRQCPGPSNPYGKFMDEGPRQRARGAAVMAIRSTHPPNEKRCVAKPAHPQSAPGEQQMQPPAQIPCTDIETVRTRLTTSGGMFRTMKIVSDDPHSESTSSPAQHLESPVPCSQVTPQEYRAQKQLRRARAAAAYGHGASALPKHLPLSGVEVLTSRLVATINEAGPTNQIKLFGPFIGEVPRRLGSTAALNDAAACLTATHDAIIRRHSKVRIDPRLYARALKSLHTAIEDPVQVKSTSTLCATVLLAITEAYAVGTCGTNRNFITHLGGAARILELRGSRDFQNPTSFERGLLRAITVGVGLDALFTEKDSILSSPAWHALAFDIENIPEPRASMFRISSTLSFLPSLNRDVRAFRAQHSSADLASSSSSTSPIADGITAYELWTRAEALRELLDDVQPYIEETLADPTRVRRVRPTDPAMAAIWPLAYRFADAGTAFVLWFYWNMRTISLLLTISLHRRPESAPFLPHRPAHVRALEEECLAMARDTCMSWEHAKACRPLGAMYIDVGLILASNVFAAFDGGRPPRGSVAADPARRQAWILTALHELTEGHPGEEHFGAEGAGVEWTSERVEWLGAWFTAGSVGRCDPPPPPAPSNRPTSHFNYPPTAFSAPSDVGSPSSLASASSGFATGSDDGAMSPASEPDQLLDTGHAGGGGGGGGRSSYLVLPPNGLRIPWPSTSCVGGSCGGL